MAEPLEEVVTLREKELVFDFVGARHGKVFDDHTHGSSCLKAVDFVVEYDDYDLEGPPTWTRPFVQSAVVLDIDHWNANGRYGTVRRVPLMPETLT